MSIHSYPYSHKLVTRFRFTSAYCISKANGQRGQVESTLIVLIFGRLRVSEDGFIPGSMIFTRENRHIKYQLNPNIGVEIV